MMIENDLRSSDGTVLRTYAAGKGPVVLIANGLGGTPDAWRLLIERFRDRFRFITWDYRGLYGSRRPCDLVHFRIADHLRDALCVLDHYGVESAVVMGWSMGVQLSLALAQAKPERVRALVLINGTFGAPFKTGPAVGAFGHFVPGLLRAALPLAPTTGRVIASLARNPLLLRFAMMAGLAGKTLDRSIFMAVSSRWSDLDYDAFFRILAALGEHDAGPGLSHVDAPTLIVHGDRDLLTPHHVTDTMLEEMPNAERFTVEGGTHYSILEQPETVTVRIDRFLLPFTRSPAGRRRAGSG